MRAEVARHARRIYCARMARDHRRQWPLKLIVRRHLPSVRSQSDFWSEEFSACPNAALTEAMVEAAAWTLRCMFPPRFVELLRLRNGGTTRGFVLPVPTSWADDHVPFEEMFGIGTNVDSFSSHDVLATPYMTAEWGLPPSQVLLAGAGDWWITLDYRSGPSPCITWLDVDAKQDVVLAPSFDAFLDALVPSTLVDPTTGRIQTRQ